MQTTTSKESIYDRVTQQIVETLERGVIPWRKGWADAGLPRSAVSGRCYRGVNVLLTSIHSLANGYTSNAYISYQQAKELGAHVRRGERGCPLVLWKPVPKRDQEVCDKSDETRSYLLCRTFTVFSLDQVEGLDRLKAIHARAAREFAPIRECESVIERMGVPIIHAGSEAFYDPSRDTITLPPKRCFHDERAYYSVLHHEAAHATGHPCRLGRDLSGRFGSDSYAMEELTAEIASAYVSAHFGIETIANTAAYVDSWLRVLRADSRAIFTVTSQSQKASDFILRNEIAEAE